MGFMIKDDMYGARKHKSQRTLFKKHERAKRICKGCKKPIKRNQPYVHFPDGIEFHLNCYVH